jgi:Domain of unknown function (DUF4145)
MSDEPAEEVEDDPAPTGPGAYLPPSYKGRRFSCPHCHALTGRTWSAEGVAVRLPSDRSPSSAVEIERCQACGGTTLWLGLIGGGTQIGGEYLRTNLHLTGNPELIWPPTLSAPPANPDLPDGMRRDFEEARSIVDASPRGAAALLRLVIQKLCKDLGATGRDLDADIAQLVDEQDLRPAVQRMLDVVRVVGNNAVHPGQMDLSDDRATATALFELVNRIVDELISEPKRLDALYSQLPEAARQHIEQRDS